MSLPVVTNPVRIYRVGRILQHDLSAFLRHSDVYGEDKWARVIEQPSDLYVIPQGTTAGAAQPVLIVLPPDTAVGVGWLIEVKSAVYYDGRLTAVETYLTSQASAGDTQMQVQATIGFRVGARVMVGRNEFVEVAAVESAALTLCADTPLMSSYAVGSPVVHSSIYKVTAAEPSSLTRVWALRYEPEIPEGT